VGGAFLLNFIQLLLMAVWVLVLGRIVMSWIDPTGRNPISVFLIQATEPILAPVRRLLPPSRTMDWSGFLVLIVLGVLWRVI
jgi:YggT family protein